MPRKHKKLPRILTTFQLRHLDMKENDREPEIEFRKPQVHIPEEIVLIILEWVYEFQKAETKDYYYSRFMHHYSKSMVTSSSRLKLFTRELKSLAMKHRTMGSPPTLLRFIKDSKRCKRKYDYEALIGIFF